MNIPRLYIIILISSLFYNTLFSQEGMDKWQLVFGQNRSEVSIKKTDSFDEGRKIVLVKFKESPKENEKTKQGFIETNLEKNRLQIAEAYKDYEYVVFTVAFDCLDNFDYEIFRILRLDHYNSKNEKITSRELGRGRWEEVNKESWIGAGVFRACQNGWDD